MTTASIHATSWSEPADEVLRRELEGAWQRLRARARDDGRPGVLALRLRVREADPLAFFLASRDDERFFWHRPEKSVQRACAGVAWSYAEREAHAGERARRFEAPARALGDLLERVEVVGDPAPAEAGPVIHAGFAFEAGSAGGAERLWAAFPDALLVLAERQVVRLGSACFAMRVALVGPDADSHGWLELLEPVGPDPEAGDRSDPRAASADDAPGPPCEAGPEYTVRADRPHARYRALVSEALAEIGRGALDKVVLARALDVQHPGHFELGGFLERLADAYPTCTTFAVARGRDVFVAATPERLVKLDGGLARTAALAGSAPRGRTPEADEAAGRELLACPKNRAEHAAVVESIVEVLGRHGRSVCVAADPRVRKLEGIQHLETPIEVKLEGERALGRPGEALLNLVGELHPTPAVGGRPRERAEDWIAAHEALDRGWYAAPVGVVELQGDGEFCVGLRSALLRARGSAASPSAHARLFAGAGIVAGSDPDAELVETRIKLRALLAPLTEI